MEISFEGIEDNSFREKVKLLHKGFMVNLVGFEPLLRTRKSIRIICSERLRTTAGYADLTDWAITLNYWMLRNDPQELSETYGHELAHLFAYDICGSNIRPHGPEWKIFMQVLKLPPDNAHYIPHKELLARRKAWKLEKEGL